MATPGGVNFEEFIYFMPVKNANNRSTPLATETASAKKNPTRVLIVDDHPLLRQGIAQLINHQSDMMVCETRPNLFITPFNGSKAKISDNVEERFCSPKIPS